MELEKRRAFIINVLYFALIAVIALLAIQYVLPICLPFVFGFMAACLVIWLSNRFPRHSRMSRLLMAILLYGGLRSFVGILGSAACRR